ncbi:hypothetical protein QVG61_11790 [Thiohalobacter sp. IOR34]|uniref:hypothetical protein n=1 Tax=Thiohalobacter sp. IOR34 TaxID=3057176 RepID=UPI0025B12342|nr:hypothetical protein [Thiohalobacter sp. IOR34]WJW75158.1 hypothetical protein QVG61_11790 [Thiohalobacter sp. IOR34]
MKKFRPLLVILLLAVLAVLLSLRDGGSPPQPPRDLPWQIEVLADGSSRVFGLHLGRDRLGDALARIGRDAELAVIAERGEPGSLELYYSRFTAGLFSGKLILAAELPAETLAGLRERAARVERLESGALKFHIRHEDRPLVLDAPLIGITFIPTVNLDEDIAERRFGIPAETLSDDSGARHLLYPDRGLDLIIHTKGKDVLQYVAPRDFERLRGPLLEDGS